MVHSLSASLERELTERFAPADRRLLLVDPGLAERARRVREDRGQPELATAAMDSWAAYLRGQADALELPVLGQAGESVPALCEQVLAALRRWRTAAATAG